MANAKAKKSKSIKSSNDSRRVGGSSRNTSHPAISQSIGTQLTIAEASNGYPYSEMNKELHVANRLFFIASQISRNKGITAPRLAELCGTSVRNIYRDIKRLDTIGVQVLSQGRDGYYLVEETLKIPARLNTEEYLAILLSPLLPTGTKLKSNPFQWAYRTAMEKIITHLRINDDLVEIGSSLSRRIRMQADPMDEQQTMVMNRIIEAVIKEETIHSLYYTMSRDKETERMIDPYYLVPRGGHLYLIGYCHEREGVRTFRINRFRQVELTGKRCFMEDDFDIDAYLTHVWGIQGGPQEVTFKVRFSPQVARYIKEESYESEPIVTDLDDGSILLEVTVKGTDEFLRWMRQYGRDAELLEPQEYRQQMLEEIREMEKMYGWSSGSGELA